MQWGVRLYFCGGAASVLSRPPMALFCGSSPGRLGDVLRTNLKNGMFLNVPHGRNPANAAKLLRRGFQPSAFVGHAARGGRIPAIRGIKKHHRFFPWSVKHPPAAPERNRKTAPPEAGRGQRPHHHKNKAAQVCCLVVSSVGCMLFRLW